MGSKKDKLIGLAVSESTTLEYIVANLENESLNGFVEKSYAFHYFCNNERTKWNSVKSFSNRGT